VTPEPNPNTKSPILAAHETSPQNKTEKAAAKTKKRIDTPIRLLLDFIARPPMWILQFIPAWLELNHSGQKVENKI
jgi:hypothetical protein